MLTIFFTIIFIAELIIAGWIISAILKVDKCVCEVNQKVLDVQPVLKKQINQFQITVNTVLLGVDYFAAFVTRKKEECVSVCSRNIITTVLYLFLSTGGKRVFAFADLIISLVKFIKKH